MGVILKPEIEKLIQDEVKVWPLVRPQRISEEEYTSEELDRTIAEGLDDIERNDTVEGAEAFNQLRAYSSEHRRQRA